MAKILITGAAGFIGFNLIDQLRHDHELLLIDALADDQHAAKYRSTFIDLPIHKLDLAIDEIELASIPDIIIHLAAETGIGPSETNPSKYVRNNILATSNLLEYCKNKGIKNFLYASSSSVYAPHEGKMSEDSAALQPKSFYGFTKLQMEQLVDEFSSRFQMNAIGLRFFTVYGPWTRPDMAAYKFMNAIYERKPITLYTTENGVVRDFTYVADICRAIALLLPEFNKSSPSHEIFNIGSSSPIAIETFYQTISSCMNAQTTILNAELPTNEAKQTYSDPSKLVKAINYYANTPIEEGIAKMVDWFKNFKYA